MEELTDEELFMLCEEAELREKKLKEKKLKQKKVVDCRDKGIDWDSEAIIWEKWNPKNFK